MDLYTNIKTPFLQRKPIIQSTPHEYTVPQKLEPNRIQNSNPIEPRLEKAAEHTAAKKRLQIEHRYDECSTNLKRFDQGLIATLPFIPWRRIGKAARHRCSLCKSINNLYIPYDKTSTEKIQTLICLKIPNEKTNQRERYRSIANQCLLVVFENQRGKINCQNLQEEGKSWRGGNPRVRVREERAEAAKDVKKLWRGERVFIDWGGREKESNAVWDVKITRY